MANRQPEGIASGIRIRCAEPSDYDPIIRVIDSWWGGRQMTAMLPRLFFTHFRPTSFVAEHEGKLVGFLSGFVSQTFRDEAYVHFVGVAPEFRANGLGRLLYEQFFRVVESQGCRVVRCVTSPVNRGSIAFHRTMGFVAEPDDKAVASIPVAENYDGAGEDRVRFVKILA